MKRLTLIAFLLSLCAVAYAAAASRAVGHGVFAMPHQTAGVFRFDVAQMGDRTHGWLHFAQVTRDGRAVVMIALPRVVHARFGRNSVRFAGLGMLNGHPVIVEVFAFDGRHSDHPDAFYIRASNRDHKTLYEARGVLAHGNIVIWHRDGTGMD